MHILRPYIHNKLYMFLKAGYAFDSCQYVAMAAIANMVALLSLTKLTQVQKLYKDVIKIQTTCWMPH